MKFSSKVIALLLSPALGKISWSPTSSGRRLGIDLVQSTTDNEDIHCVVGGYDTDNPSKVYIGGPCKELNGTEPGDGFRWVEMETINIALHNLAGEKAAMEEERDNQGNTATVMHAENKETHAEVGIAGYFHMADENATKAAMFASTTSYLVKSKIEYNENTFVIGKTGDVYSTMDTCVQPCCDSPGETGCSCDAKCPDTKTAAQSGDFKYSILAAAYDFDDATSTATGNGWQRLESLYGSGDPKEIKGHLLTYQSIDFTNMKADTVTVIGKDATAKKYSEMTECDIMGQAECPTTAVYSVASIKAAAAGWEGVVYSFPQTFNRGQWSYDAAASKYSSTPGDTMQVVIECVKPTSSNLAQIYGLSANTTEVAAQLAAKKVIMLRYKFDVSGITATKMSGKYVVYDPTVNTASGKDANDKAASHGQVSAGRLATVPAMFVLAMFGAVVSLF